MSVPYMRGCKAKACRRVHGFAFLNNKDNLTLSRAPKAASRVTPSFSPASCSTLRRRPWAASVASYSPPTNRTNSSALTIRSPSRPSPLLFRPEDEDVVDVLFRLWTKERTYRCARTHHAQRGRCTRREQIDNEALIVILPRQVGKETKWTGRQRVWHETQ